VLLRAPGANKVARRNESYSTKLFLKSSARKKHSEFVINIILTGSVKKTTIQNDSIPDRWANNRPQDT
jgi:hypothetical protein